MDPESEGTFSLRAFSEIMKGSVSDQLVPQLGINGSLKCMADPCV